MNSDNKKQPNYRAFVGIGTTFMGVGVVFIAAVNPGVGVAFLGFGIVFLVIGLSNRDKWE
jgi:hypothetical protein